MMSGTVETHVLQKYYPSELLDNWGSISDADVQIFRVSLHTRRLSGPDKAHPRRSEWLHDVRCLRCWTIWKLDCGFESHSGHSCL